MGFGRATTVPAGIAPTTGEVCSVRAPGRDSLVRKPVDIVRHSNTPSRRGAAPGH